MENDGETDRATTDRDGRWVRRLRIVGWSAAAVLLATPLVAMQFTDEVNWTLSDFVFMGVMFGMAGGVCELAVRLSGSWAFRAGVAVAVGTGFLLIWINLAVGIIGSENNPANGLYGMVLGIVLLGALLARFRPLGMAATMTAAAAAQIMVGIVALFLGHVVIPLTIAFAAMWLVSAWLFRSAAEGRAPAR